jgi:hypothetical protein
MVMDISSRESYLMEGSDGMPGQMPDRVQIPPHSGHGILKSVKSMHCPL